MLRQIGDSLCSVSCLVLGAGNTLTLQEREFIQGGMCFPLFVTLEGLTGKADWQQLLEDIRPQCSSWETEFCLPLPFSGVFQDL